MTRIDDNLGGKSKYLRAEGFGHLLHAAAWQIGAPDTALEKGVATEQQMVGGQIKRKTARGMAWGVEDTKGGMPKSEFLTVGKVTCHGDNGFCHLHLEPFARHNGSELIDALLEGMA